MITIGMSRKDFLVLLVIVSCSFHDYLLMVGQGGVGLILVFFLVGWPVMVWLGW